MKKRLICMVAGVAALALPASASALVQATPASLTFPERQVGSTSDPQTFQVIVTCPIFNNMTLQCTPAEVFTNNPQFTGANPGDFTQTNTCGNGAVVATANNPFVCVYTIRFVPKAAGTRTATLLVGSSGGAQGGGPNPVTLSGSATPAPTQTTGTTTTTATGQRAAALAKCKSKKSKKARKKCRARANLLPV